MSVALVLRADKDAPTLLINAVLRTAKAAGYLTISLCPSTGDPNETCSRLVLEACLPVRLRGSTTSIGAYDAAPPTALPDGFMHARRFAAALCATLFLHLAREAGHAGGDVAVDRAPTLLDVHGLMAIGAFAPNTAEGAWAFALALVRTITDSRQLV